MIQNYDVLIIGTGIAGLSAAAKLAENENLSIALVTREKDPHVSNTLWAQGGVIYLDESDHKIKDDIQKASSASSNEEAIDCLRQNYKRIFDDLIIDKAKTNFERDEQNNLKVTLEAAHSKERILYRGDYTGKELQVSLLNYIKSLANVKIYDSHTAIDLLTPDHHGVSLSQRYEVNKVVGAYVLDQRSEEVKKILAKVTMLATGGIGGLYLHHSNAEGARGDGHAMAKRAGANLLNMEFVQFHPTTFFDRSTHRRFLISEAVRGEGGVLINSRGEAFMSKYHQDKELASRDIVARAIVNEIIETRHDCVYLDITHKDPLWVKNRFPTIYTHCLDKNIDITKEPIPVVPAAHYTCGGVKSDLYGKTSLPNLYAIGEVACTGLHGANRLASTSLAEGITWGYLAAENILADIEKIESYDGGLIKEWIKGTEEADPMLVQQDWLTLKQTMWNYVGLIRSKNRLNRAEAMFKELYDEIQLFYRHAKLQDSLIGLRNAVEVGHMVLKSSQRNSESLGCFYRADEK